MKMSDGEGKSTLAATMKRDKMDSVERKRKWKKKRERGRCADTKDRNYKTTKRINVDSIEKPGSEERGYSEEGGRR